MFHKGVSVKAVVGKFQGYWGTLPRQSKVKCVCDPVSSKMPLTNTDAIAAYEKTLRGIFIYKYAESYRVSVIDLVFQWVRGGGGGWHHL